MTFTASFFVGLSVFMAILVLGAPWIADWSETYWKWCETLIKKRKQKKTREFSVISPNEER